MSYLNMHAEITIGDMVITALNSFEIHEDVNNVSDRAVIRIARNYKELAGNPILNYIVAGSPVEIKCGYNGELHTEFTGFVKPSIGDGFPVEIHCDEDYPLRGEQFNISEKSISLKSLLTKIAPNYVIECPDVDLGKVRYSKRTAIQILNEIKKTYGFFSHLDNNVLSVGFCFDFKPLNTKNHIYTIGSNVKDADNLKYEQERDQNIKVTTVIKVLGHKIPLSFGSKEPDAKEIKPVLGENISQKDAMKALQANYQRVAYDGFTGSIKGFGEPRTHAGDSLTIIDKLRPERNGTYLIERMSLKFDNAYIERENFITFRVD